MSMQTRGKLDWRSVPHPNCIRKHRTLGYIFGVERVHKITQMFHLTNGR